MEKTKMKDLEVLSETLEEIQYKITAIMRDIDAYTTAKKNVEDLMNCLKESDWSGEDFNLKCQLLQDVEAEREVLRQFSITDLMRRLQAVTEKMESITQEDENEM